MYQIIELNNDELTAQFAEGALLAANCAVKPLDPDSWMPTLFGEQDAEQNALFKQQLQAQYSILKRGEWQVFEQFDQEQFADFAEGFMSLWPTIEAQWMEVEVLESTQRMLQALLTTLMLAIDEQQTQQQMIDAGIENPPCLEDLLPQFAMMVNEVVMAADEHLVGLQSQRVNPFKSVGRNDDCPCGSGKKFKQCCGK